MKRYCMDTETLTAYLTDRQKFCSLMAKISICAAMIFIAYGWLVTGSTQTIIIGMFFLICFFGFWYAKRKIVKVEHGRTFFGTTPDPASHLASMKDQPATEEKK